MATIPLFKTGIHTDMNGNTLSFSEDDLTLSAAAYNPSIHEAPLVIGHPSHEAPAWGWVKSLDVSAGNMIAIADQVNADFAELYKNGSYKKVSASFYPPHSKHNPVPGVYYLRHVGFLGAQPPAIKGLRASEFSEADDCITIEFSETSETTQPTEEDTTVTPEEAAALAAQNQQLQQQLAAAQAEADSAKATAAKIETDRRHEKNLAFAETLAAETRISKDSVPVYAQALTELQNLSGDVANFGEGDAAKPLHEVLAASLKAMPPRVEFGEFATKDKVKDDDKDEDAVQYAENTPPESIALDKKIRAYMKTNGVDYTTAAHAVANK
ncbi:hypothetical protein [Gynuella sp.]